MLPNTVAVTEPLPTFPYWSVNVISESIVSPLWVTEPLISTPSVKFPLLFTKIAGFDDVNDWIVGEPLDGE